MIRKVPENPKTRRQAWRAMKQVCTKYPQRDEVYEVEHAVNFRGIGREIWIMRSADGHLLNFIAYGRHADIQHVNGRIRIIKNHQEPKPHSLPKKGWDALQNTPGNYCKFLGFWCHYRKESNGA